MAFLSGRRRKTAGPGGNGGLAEVPDLGEGVQPELFGGQRPQPEKRRGVFARKEAEGAPVRDLFGSKEAEPERTPELFKVMEKVMLLLKGVVSQGAVRRVSREELLDQLAGVLSGYHQLKGTPYQDAVNNFLMRTCSSNFSLLLGENELEVLWS